MDRGYIEQQSPMGAKAGDIAAAGWNGGSSGGGGSRSRSARARADTTRFEGTQARPAILAPDKRRATAGTLCEVPRPWHGARWYVRAIEIPVALAGLILTLPVMLVIGWLIRRDSPGPALFFQDRIGLGGKPFRFVKFRTLHADARKRFPELYAYDYSREALPSLKFKIENDPRVTRVGRWLRQVSLDELPNLWNVLTGDMALCGPRPEIPEMLRYYQGDMLLKFSVRPGVTGLAQVSGRGRLTFFDTVAYDLTYVRTRSFLGDVKVLAKTVRMVVLRDGAF